MAIVALKPTNNPLSAPSLKGTWSHWILKSLISEFKYCSTSEELQGTRKKKTSVHLSLDLRTSDLRVFTTTNHVNLCVSIYDME